MGGILVAAKKVESVSDFVQFVMEWSNDGKRPTAFRGQSFVDWVTIPKVFRSDVGLYPHENTAVRELVSVHPQEFFQDGTMFDRLVRMQHFELPTRLLDVTINPLVALWFAAQDFIKDEIGRDGKVQALFVPTKRLKYYDSDSVSCMANMSNLKFAEKQQLNKSLKLSKIEFNKLDATRSLEYYIRMEKPHFERDMEPVDLLRPVFVRPKMNNIRIIAQSGAFLLFGIKPPGDKFSDTDLIIKKCIIPHAAKKKLRDELERLGIHASALFPEIDKAANFIVRRYQSDNANDLADLI
jgi:hypothetical protein